MFTSVVPPFFKNEVLDRMLSRYGKLFSSINMIPIGKHVIETMHIL